MEIIRAIILGIIQGLTEFLPVSSSGHLELGKYIMGDESVGEESLLMTVVLHAATALSTMVVFRRDIGSIMISLISFKWDENIDLVAKIAVSMIPAVVIGLSFEEEIESLFGGNIGLVGLMLIVTGLFLLLADMAKNTEKGVGYKTAWWIGVAQAIAILPGVSRSGATISTSVLLNVDRSKAARFSFLMVLPLIFGKIAKDFLEWRSGELIMAEYNMFALSLGFLAAFLTGLVACTLMIKLVKESKLVYFSVYCFVVGVLALVWNFI